MESVETRGFRKRMKPTMEEKEGEVREGAGPDNLENEGTDPKILASEEMELNIGQILDKIERFTQLVSDLLESGKTMFAELSQQFEERLIMVHREQIEKWQEDVKALRLLDASNEEANATLHNARFLLQNPHIDS